MQEREARTPVTMHAHMRGKGEWSRVVIRNISPHGMMALAAHPPRPGAYVEIRKASMTLVGRAIWVKGTAFGIQLIERLNFNALLRAAGDSFIAAQNGSTALVEPVTAPPPARARQTVSPILTAVVFAIAVVFAALAMVCAGTQAGF